MSNDAVSNGAADNGERGTMFGPYRLDGLLGRGGMGEVYRAYDTGRDRVVALKLLGGTATDDGTFAERFRRECQMAARLGEPHIIPIHDFGEIDGRLYLDMRLVEGEDLRQVLRRMGTLAPDQAVDIVGQVASALDAAHAAGLVHRDVKPENILVTPTGFVYLVDFGIAHDAADTALTRAGSAIGSTAYLAPEHFDNAPASPASDVYSLSVVLFELLTGRPPYHGETVSAVIKASVLSEAPRVSALNPAVPAGLDEVLAIGLAKNPAQRFPTAGALAAAAQEALTRRPQTAQYTVGEYPVAEYSVTQHAAVPPQYTGPQSSGPQYSGPQYSGPQYSGPQYSGPQYSGPVGYAAPPQSDNRAQLVLAGIIGLLIAGLVGLAVYYFGFADRGGANQAAAPSSTTTITSVVTPEETAAVPPPNSSPCTADVGVGTGVTSCAFAASVRQAYLAAGPKGQARTIDAHSPVTGQTYSMACVPESGIVVCRGGNNAVVHIY